LQAALPFQLTGRNNAWCGEIAHDLARAVPMHRLLQGDVGSGKTVVAALAAAHVHRRGLAMRADGAHRNFGRAAFRQTDGLAGARAGAAGLASGLAHR